MKLLLTVSALALALASPAMAGQLSGSVGVTNNYVARGTAQNYNGGPSVMVNANYDFDSGFYVGGFAANVDFEEDEFGFDEATKVELSGWAGYRHKVGPVTLDYMFGSYNYLGDNDIPLDMIEAKVAATVPVGKASVTSSVGWTPDYFAILGSSWWVDTTVSYPVTPKITASAGVGRQIIDERGNGVSAPFNPDGYSYTTWNLGATYQVNPKWSVEARYYDTDRSDLGAVYSANPYGKQFAVTVRRGF
jgi:uncharacterized protein (TIGR02001 family)